MPDETPTPLRLGTSRASLVARFRVSDGALLTATHQRGHRRVREPRYYSARAGRTAVRLKGRLRAGHYRLILSAVDGALNRSARAVRFHVSG
ncbi:MAG: hypothetical protein QOE86_1827 [Solirubrobacteraceae bacterium]|jgi:hypothetical protein|nr:hypothetical protein [Solirubrobacteraceae bacterium]